MDKVGEGAGMEARGPCRPCDRRLKRHRGEHGTRPGSSGSVREFSAMPRDDF